MSQSECWVAASHLKTRLWQGLLPTPLGTPGQHSVFRAVRLRASLLAVGWRPHLLHAMWASSWAVYNLAIDIKAAGEGKQDGNRWLW
jgi:hypothetical protein